MKELSGKIDWRTQIELDFPVKRREIEFLFLPVEGDYIHVRGLMAGMEEFKVFRREFDVERELITIFVKRP